MHFEKQIMTTKELRACGFTKEFLRRVYGAKDQNCAFKADPLRTHSPILFDTAKLAEWIEQDIKTQSRGMRRT